jgi:integrase
VAHRSGKAVELPDDDSVEAPAVRIGHQAIKLRARLFRAADANVNVLVGDSPATARGILLELTGLHRWVLAVIDEQNPMRDITIPKSIRRKKFHGEVYTVREILKLLECVAPSPVAFAVVATAAFTGLRLAELRGLQWRDFNPEKKTLSVARTMWRTSEGLPKTETSEASVPLLPIFQAMLENYRHHLEGLPEEGNLGKTLKPTD